MDRFYFLSPVSLENDRKRRAGKVGRVVQGRKKEEREGRGENGFSASMKQNRT